MPTMAGVLAVRAGMSMAMLPAAAKVRQRSAIIVASPKGCVSMSRATSVLRPSAVDSQKRSTRRRSNRSAMAPPKRLKSSIAAPRLTPSRPTYRTWRAA